MRRVGRGLGVGEARIAGVARAAPVDGVFVERGEILVRIDVDGARGHVADAGRLDDEVDNLVVAHGHGARLGIAAVVGVRAFVDAHFVDAGGESAEGLALLAQSAQRHLVEAGGGVVHCLEPQIVHVRELHARHHRTYRHRSVGGVVAGGVGVAGYGHAQGLVVGQDNGVELVAALVHGLFVVDGDGVGARSQVDEGLDARGLGLRDGVGRHGAAGGVVVDGRAVFLYLVFEPVGVGVALHGQDYHAVVGRGALRCVYRGAHCQAELDGGTAGGHVAGGVDVGHFHIIFACGQAGEFHCLPGCALGHHFVYRGRRAGGVVGQLDAIAVVVRSVGLAAGNHYAGRAGGRAFGELEVGEGHAHGLGLGYGERLGNLAAVGVGHNHRVAAGGQIVNLGKVVLVHAGHLACHVGRGGGAHLDLYGVGLGAAIGAHAYLTQSRIGRTACNVGVAHGGFQVVAFHVVVERLRAVPAVGGVGHCQSVPALGTAHGVGLGGLHQSALVVGRAGHKHGVGQGAAVCGRRALGIAPLVGVGVGRGRLHVGSGRHGHGYVAVGGVLARHLAAGRCHADGRRQVNPLGRLARRVALRGHCHLIAAAVGLGFGGESCRVERFVGGCSEAVGRPCVGVRIGSGCVCEVPDSQHSVIEVARIVNRKVEVYSAEAGDVVCLRCFALFHLQAADAGQRGHGQRVGGAYRFAVGADERGQSDGFERVEMVALVVDLRSHLDGRKAVGARPFEACHGLDFGQGAALEVGARQADNGHHAVALAGARLALLDLAHELDFLGVHQLDLNRAHCAGSGVVDAYGAALVGHAHIVFSGLKGGQLRRVANPCAVYVPPFVGQLAKVVGDVEPDGSGGGVRVALGVRHYRVHRQLRQRYLVKLGHAGVALRRVALHRMVVVDIYLVAAGLQLVEVHLLLVRVGQRARFVNDVRAVLVDHISAVDGAALLGRAGKCGSDGALAGRAEHAFDLHGRNGTDVVDSDAFQVVGHAVGIRHGHVVGTGRKVGNGVGGRLVLAVVGRDVVGNSLAAQLDAVWRFAVDHQHNLALGIARAAVVAGGGAHLNLVAKHGEVLLQPAAFVVGHLHGERLAFEQHAAKRGAVGLALAHCQAAYFGRAARAAHASAGQGARAVVPRPLVVGAVAAVNAVELDVAVARAVVGANLLGGHKHVGGLLYLHFGRGGVAGGQGVVLAVADFHNVSAGLAVLDGERVGGLSGCNRLGRALHERLHQRARVHGVFLYLVECVVVVGIAAPPCLGRDCGRGLPVVGVLKEGVGRTRIVGSGHDACRNVRLGIYRLR